MVAFEGRSSGLCCTPLQRPQLNLPSPAPLYGAYRKVLNVFNLATLAKNSRCDTLYTLGLAALNLSELCLALEQRLLPQLGIYSGIYSGDLVSHDSQNQVSRAYLEYTETSAYDISKSCIKNPVFSVLCNHDYNPEGMGPQHPRSPGKAIQLGLGSCLGPLKE